MRYTLKDLYDDYVVTWLSEHDEGEPACYEEWLDNEFTEVISNLPYYVQCVLYNEFAEAKGCCTWDAIDNLYNLDLKTIYPKINYKEFNIDDDIYVYEYNKIVSYTYKDFLKSYSDANTLAEYIHLFGLENLKCYDLLAIRVV